ncbi:MAG: hypothetical protein OYI31_06600 [Chloroflexota bacterium]|nr:hypothetical protein [Chloroflexota bacterium]MDE2941476.1 hypothetical protein [Chloroflexota bacterium]MDE3268100.1 hypothetical protein [Chloroflexota bacterium]
MDEKVCAVCAQVNPADANFCTNCRGQTFVQAPTELGENDPGRPLLAEGYALQISTARIIVLSIVTSGVYVLYWLYKTWQQLQSETKDLHYPFWHAATMFVPVYGLFRIHRHLSVIQELAQRRGVESLMTPALGVTLMALYWVIVLVSGNQVDFRSMIVLGLIRLALITTMMVRAQRTLNAYWTSLHESRAVRFPLGMGEIRFLLIVLAAQVTLTLVMGSLSGSAT